MHKNRIGRVKVNIKKKIFKILLSNYKNAPRRKCGVVFEHCKKLMVMLMLMVKISMVKKKKIH